MNRLVKRIHIWVGLLSFLILLVDGITGIGVTFLPRYEDRSRPAPSVEMRDYVVPGNLSDNEAADRIWEHLRLPLTNPPRYGVQRDENNDLAFAFYTPKSVIRVTALEKEGKLRLETTPAGAWMFLNNLHATTVRDLPRDWRMRLWVLYNEFAIAALLFLSLSGVYLWLSARPRHRLAQISLVAGAGSFIALYWLSR
ncbi:MAG: PepSY-associated TM helix domain-containing protein [Bryobacteraceae bacterium]|nr:PepSY-associated TM helix domain-containing protein [Bryobacteraceae bacterium]